MYIPWWDGCYIHTYHSSFRQVTITHAYTLPMTCTKGAGGHVQFKVSACSRAAGAPKIGKKVVGRRRRGGGSRSKDVWCERGTKQAVDEEEKDTVYQSSKVLFWDYTVQRRHSQQYSLLWGVEHRTSCATDALVTTRLATVPFASKVLLHSVTFIYIVNISSIFLSSIKKWILARFL